MMGRWMVDGWMDDELMDEWMNKWMDDGWMGGWVTVYGRMKDE